MGVQIQGDTGNVIATKGTYSGDVSIGGTLTYEDVTNIDSVGLITARKVLRLVQGNGVAASISVDGNMIFWYYHIWWKCNCWNWIQQLIYCW